MSASFQVVGGTRRPTITQAAAFTPGQSAPTVDAIWRQALTDTNRPFEDTYMSDDWSLVETKVLMNTAGVLTSYTNPAVYPGASTDPFVSPQVSLIVQKVTGLAGRQYRGRMFAPACILGENNVEANGSLQPSYQILFQAKFNGMFNALFANGVNPALLHEAPLVGPVPPPTNVIAYLLTPLTGTNRRRIR